MKLTKVSLAALVALGAFSSVASATPLEEAIKNVDMTGFARYRYTNTKTTKTDGETGKSDKGVTNANHQFRSFINFKAAFDDRFFGVLGVRYNSSDFSGNNYDNKEIYPRKDYTNTQDTFAVSEVYLGYTAQNTTLTAGRQVIGTFFTDDEVGTGLRLVNTDIEGLTLAAVAFDSLDKTSFTVDGGLLEKADEIDSDNYDKDLKPYDLGNLYGVAAIGSYDPVSFQLWYASLEHVADLFAVEVAGDVSVSDDVSFSLKGQFVNNDADKKLKETELYNDGHFYAFEAGSSFFGIDFTAGYMGWKVKPIKDEDKRSSFSFEDQGSLIDVGETNYDYTWMTGKGSQWFATLGYKFDKFGVGVDYRNGTTKFVQKDLLKEKQDEYVLRASYSHSKKLKFSTFYSETNTKNVEGVKGDKNKKSIYRFEAKYSF